MKILIHAVGAAMGGGRTHLQALLPALAAHESEHDYVVLVRSGMLKGLECAGIQVREIPTKSSATGIKRLYFDQWVLPRILREGGFDICISLLNFGPVICPTKHVIFQRNALYFDRQYLRKEPLHRQAVNRIRGWIAGMSVRRADLVVTPSYAMRDLLADAFPKLPAHKFVVLYHGFNLRDRNRRPSQIEGPADHQNKSLSIFYPSHFARHKGYDVLIRTASKLVDLGVDFHLTVTVSPDYWPGGFEWFQKSIMSPALEGRITNHGSISPLDICDLYEQSDVVFFPSQCESFGFPMLEAMGAEKPLVVSDILINQEICGAAADYFPSSDSDAAAEKLSRLVNKEYRRDSAVRSARRFAERDWSWKAYAARFDYLMGSYDGD